MVSYENSGGTLRRPEFPVLRFELSRDSQRARNWTQSGANQTQSLSITWPACLQYAPRHPGPAARPAAQRRLPALGCNRRCHGDEDSRGEGQVNQIAVLQK
jgi:hypothetical protein